MAVRDYGSGSIIARGGGWYLRWYVVDPLTGRRVRRVETFKGTKKAAQARLADLVARSGIHTATDGSTVSLAACIDRWLDVARHEPSTRRNYELGLRTIPRHVLEAPIATLRAPALAALVDAIVERDGVHRARLVHATISGALTQAWRWEWIADNPARRVSPPAVPKRAKTAPAPEQVRALLELVVDDPQLHCWLLLSADLGSRRSEVLGLTWAHIDLDRAEVLVEQALDPLIPGRVKQTKTQDRRTVAMSNLTAEALRAWRSRAEARARSVGAMLDKDAFVLSDHEESIRPWRPDTATKRFGRLRSRVPGMQSVRLYDLRHFVATQALAAGIDPKTVAGRMGHSRVATTTDVYGHVVRARDREVADLMDGHLRAG